MAALLTGRGGSLRWKQLGECLPLSRRLQGLPPAWACSQVKWAPTSPWSFQTFPGPGHTSVGTKTPCMKNEMEIHPLCPWWWRGKAFDGLPIQQSRQVFTEECCDICWMKDGRHHFGRESGATPLRAPGTVSSILLLGGLAGLAVFQQGVVVHCSPRLVPSKCPAPKAPPTQYERRSSQSSAANTYEVRAPPQAAEDAGVSVSTRRVPQQPSVPPPLTAYGKTHKKRHWDTDNDNAYQVAPYNQKGCPPGPPIRMNPDRPGTPREAASVAPAKAPAAKAMPSKSFLPIDEAQRSQAKSWTMRVLQAAMMDTSKQGALLSEAHQLTVTMTIAYATGCGMALSTGWLWEGLDPPRQTRRTVLVKKWMAQNKTEKESMMVKFGEVQYPPRLQKSLMLKDAWKEQLFEIRSWLECLADETHLMEDATKLSVRLFLHGFRSIDDLEGLPEPSIQKITDVPREQALLHSAIRLVKDASFRKRARKMCNDLGIKSMELQGPRSADELAASLTPAALASLEESNKELEESLGIAVGWEAQQGGLMMRTGPRETTQKLAEAVKTGRGLEVTAFLDSREQTLKLETQRRSLPQVASGLRAWHAFAVGVLHYDPSATLPPGCTQDVVKYLQVFSNAGTAANYLGHLRWACKAYKKGVTWSTPELGMLIKGLQKMDLRTRIAGLPDKYKLEEMMVMKIVKLARDLGDMEFSWLACWSYHFLLRVPSEAVPLEVGQPSDAQGKLPLNRHSALWMEDERVYLKLQRRKHRPGGSLLIRHCQCSVADSDEWFCPVHCCSLRYAAQGTQILPEMTATKAVKKLRRYLGMLSAPAADQATLKVFRASKATNLCLQGKPVAAVLAAGEWRSAAVLNYVDDDLMLRADMSREAMLLRTIVDSESETE